MIKKFFAWLFGGRVEALEDRIRKLERTVVEYEKSLMIIVNLRVKDEKIQLSVTESLGNINKSIEGLAQLAAMNHERLKILEEINRSGAPTAIDELN